MITTQLFTRVDVALLPFRLDFGTGIVTIGSCFSDEIGQRLADGGFRVERNPFGTLYNPASIAAALDRIVEEREITHSDLVEHEGLVHSWHHHGSFSCPSADETLALCNARIHQTHQALKEASLLMVTFGTAWVFELVCSEECVVGSTRAQMLTTNHYPLTTKIVANCHKLPAETFVRRRMSVDEIVAMWQPLLQKLYAFNAQLAVLFTVSPIRHLADGAHGNQLSKSTLLLAVDRLVIRSSGRPAGQSLNYFPAYEIVLDELRDYRFYGPDMTHPTTLAADMVYDRFQQATMLPAIIQQAHNNAKQAKRENHVPLHKK